MNGTNVQSTQYRRTVVLDIETVSLDPSLPKGALDALTGRIVCIAMLIDDGTWLTEVAIADEDELRILTEFWAAVKTTDLLVGHNAMEFDLPFIRQRSWVHGVRPSRIVDLRRFYTVDVQDTMQLWTNWGFKKGVTLDALGGALGCGQKAGHGEDVSQWWATGDLDSIKRYCLEDVRLTYSVHCKLTYQQPQFRKLKPQAAPVSVPQQSIPTAPNRRRNRRGSG